MAKYRIVKRTVGSSPFEYRLERQRNFLGFKWWDLDEFGYGASGPYSEPYDGSQYKTLEEARAGLRIALGPAAVYIEPEYEVIQVDGRFIHEGSYT